MAMSRSVVVVAVVAGAALGLAQRVEVPYYSIGPAPARSVEPLVQISGHERHPSSGGYLFTAVVLDPLTIPELVWAWIDPALDVVPAIEVVPAGQTFEEQRERNISLMDQSKLNAVAAALRAVTGYPRDRGSGAIVQGVVPGCAADGVLYPGDLIVAVDGRAVDGVRQAARAIEAAPSGARLTFSITVDGAPDEVTLVREPCGGSEEPLVGISMLDAFPFEVRIDSGEVGGPSAGLMFALSLVELLEPGDLNGGALVAGTGEIGPSGAVLPVGSVRFKVIAAERAGATVFLVPADNLEEARSAGAEIELVPVEDLADAIAYLRGTAAA